MPFTKKLFDLFIFSSLFIATGAVFMTWQTCLLFDLKPSVNLLAFVFCGTVASYNFHWFLTQEARDSEKIRWNIHNRRLHLMLAVAGVLGAGYFVLTLAEHLFFLAFTAIFTFLYSAPKIPHKAFAFLKRIAVGKTIFLAFAWTHVTATLPLVVGGTHLTEQEMIYIMNRFLFIYSICIIFDYRDRELDRKERIRSMVTSFSEKNVDRLFWSSIVLCLVTFALMFKWMDPLHGALLLLPMFPLCIFYGYFKKRRSDFLYYFVLDGLMIISAPMLVLAKFAR